MKALGISFSARKKGNCADCINYILDRLRDKGFETETISAYDHKIVPCSHCNYECFSNELRGRDEECPIHDDVPKIYDKWKQADIIVLAVPTYAGKPSGLYSAFKERAQNQVAKKYQEFKDSILNKTVALVVIGNVPAGGDLSYHIVISDHLAFERPSTSLLLQSTEYGQRSIHGTLTQDRWVTDQLDGLVALTLKRWENKQ